MFSREQLKHIHSLRIPKQAELFDVQAVRQTAKTNCD